jgi:hypothetical protein
MEFRFKCHDCEKDLEFHEIYFLPEAELVENTGLRWAQGTRFCLECYEKHLESFIDIPKKIETKERSTKGSKISELETGSQFKEIRVVVEKKLSEENKTVYGKELILTKFKVTDDSGGIIFTLWSSDIDQINRIKEGEVLVIKNGYVRVFGKDKYLTVGREGKLIILEE